MLVGVCADWGVCTKFFSRPTQRRIFAAAGEVSGIECARCAAHRKQSVRRNSLKANCAAYQKIFRESWFPTATVFFKTPCPLVHCSPAYPNAKFLRAPYLIIFKISKRSAFYKKHIKNIRKLNARPPCARDGNIFHCPANCKSAQKCNTGKHQWQSADSNPLLSG